MYELIVVWFSGEKEKYTYSTMEEAKTAADGYKIAFGSQVWTCINKKGGI